MIKILGIEGSNEYNAAKLILEAFVKQWPDIENSPPEIDLIIIGAPIRISGYPKGELDIVILGSFTKKRFFRPTRVLKDKSGKNLDINKPIHLENFIVVVEEKSHAEDGIRFVGDTVNVKYRNIWSDATDANQKQAIELGNYFRDYCKANFFIYRSLFLSGLNRCSVRGTLTRNLKASNFFTEFLSIAQNGIFQNNKGQYVVSSGKAEDMKFASAAPIFQEVVPSALDRKRMDQIVQKNQVTIDLENCLGEKFCLIRGPGGAGKTLSLLQTAWGKFKNYNQSSLFLTYNIALAADTTRLLSLLGAPSGSDEGGITVSTVKAFFRSWIVHLGVVEENEFEVDDKEYLGQLSETIELITKGGLSLPDIKALKSNHPDNFDFDYIFIDEGQDWPDEEISLLKLLYDIKTVAVADGVEQLVRGTKANWLTGMKGEDKLVVPMNECLRLKQNLSSFVKTLADKTNVPIDFKLNSKAAGGKIKILKSSYREQIDLHSLLFSSAKKSGNDAIDFLFCVPSNQVFKQGSSKTTQISKFLESTGSTVWDGVDETLRRHFPRSKGTFRVVQYQSCRGLEGWVVVLHGFDTFLQSKFEERVSLGLTENDTRSFKSIEDVAMGHAWRWAMIALTRGIDTLVIQLDDSRSQFSKLILNEAQKKDFVEIL